MAMECKEMRRLREEFLKKADRMFDSMFDVDQQEQLITMTEREDRVLEKGAELQSWLLGHHLRLDPLADPSEAEAICCPNCHEVGIRDPNEVEPVPRGITTRAGRQQIERLKYYCSSCRRVFFPLRSQA